MSAPKPATELLYHGILARRAGYTPEWTSNGPDAGTGLARVAAGQLDAVLRRLAQAPEKRKLAFLDLAGVSLIRAQSARAPIVFQLSAQAASGVAPVGTIVMALPPPGSPKPILFETERSLGVTAGRVQALITLWPARDEYIDHLAAHTAGELIRAFSPSLLVPTPHALYLSHQKLLALNGNVELGVEFEILRGSRESLEVVWEYWDGAVWRGFASTIPQCLAEDAAKVDGTGGLVRSGTVLLKADCTQAAEIEVNGSKGFWLRGRLTQPLPAAAQAALPEVESIRLSSKVNRTLRGTLAVSDPITASVALAGAPTNIAAPPAALATNTQTIITGRVLNSAGQPVKGAVVTMITGGIALKSAPTVLTGDYLLPPLTLSSDAKPAFLVTWAEIEFQGPAGGPVSPKIGPSGSTSFIDLTITVSGLQPDKAFADASKLDTSKPFYPLGQQPQPGTTFYFSSEEILAKPGAKVSMFLARTRSPQDESTLTVGTASETPLAHRLEWQYWNSRAWAPLAVTSTGLADLDGTEMAAFTVPADLAPVTVNEEEALWIRARLQSGAYGVRKEVSFQTDAGTNEFTYVIPRPPALGDFRLGYTWQYGPWHPEQVFTYNDFGYDDHTYEATWPGTTFLPFERVADAQPALYIGFDKQPPTDALGLYFDMEEDETDPRGPALAWEYWDGLAWREFPTEDGTEALRRPGIVNLLAQPDDATLNRFGAPLHWIRARLREDGPPGEPVIKRLYPNAVWASEQQTLRDVPVGTSNGTPSQVFAITQIPVLEGEQMEVREFQGARADVEWRVVALELAGGDASVLGEIERQLASAAPTDDVVYGSLRLKRDRRNKVSEVWVAWTPIERILFAGERDRVYELDRASGRLLFGDAIHGRIPNAGAVILIRKMASGGGLGGNVKAGAISQLVGAVSGVESVVNPRAAEGGANGEALSSLLERGPKTLRHRGRAITAADFEVMAREASPSVAYARAVPLRAPAANGVAGWVTLMIVPYGEEPRPYPSFGLREHVRAYLEARASASLAAAHRIAVIGPEYEPVDVTATIAPLVPSEAGNVERLAREAIEAFLHPVTGGPEGRGWTLGRSVYVSDLAAVLEAVAGMDYVERLEISRNCVVAGGRADISPTGVAVAGAITLRIKRPER
ncbi:MAG: putative baseplate assembly protein [Bryobacteraceae bacterium]|nr:putative baseplate assembly protein [Bryobacteraceae bacterium]